MQFASVQLKISDESVLNTYISGFFCCYKYTPPLNVSDRRLEHTYWRERANPISVRGGSEDRAHSYTGTDGVSHD